MNFPTTTLNPSYRAQAAWSLRAAVAMVIRISSAVKQHVIGHAPADREIS